MTIADLFHPLPAARFLVQHYNASAFHAPGHSDRFSALDAELIARQLERELEAEVRTQGMQDSAPLELHRGERDVIVLQLSGAVRWRLHGNTKEATPEPTSHEVAKAGSAIYIPRGFWQTCEPVADGSCHFEFQIHNPTALDFLDWLIGKVKELDAFQSDLPRFAAPAVQAAYLKTLRQSVGGAFRAPGMIEAYGRRLNRLARAHSVPETADQIVLAAPRIPGIHRYDASTIFLSVAGKDLRFPIAAAPLLQYVIDRAPMPLSDFYDQFLGDFDSEELASFLAALSRDGVIVPLGGLASSS